MFSIALYKRLWSNHRAYTLLWNHGFRIEGDVVLRSGIEAAICIAAAFNIRVDFVHLMRADAAYTIQSEIKMLRDGGEKKAIIEREAVLRLLQSGLPAGKKAQKLDWKSLAELGGVPQLYGFHRSLSGHSSHVTGISLLPDFAYVDGGTAIIYLT